MRMRQRRTRRDMSQGDLGEAVGLVISRCRRTRMLSNTLSGRTETRRARNVPFGRAMSAANTLAALATVFG
jgi:hypothetical protein